MSLSGAGHNARLLPQDAGNAVANGLSWQAGLEAITINPAKIFGIDESFGSLAAGKEADVVIWDGDPLEVMTSPDHVFIRGEEIELGFLSDRREALTNLTNRVPLKAVRSVVATLIQTEKYGTPLAHSLRVLSQEMRNDRMMRAEEKAARLPAIMTIPLIMFILPMLFIILLGPAACSIADNVVGRF